MSFGDRAAKIPLADCSISKQAVAGFIQLTPMARTERSLLLELESLMAWLSMLRLDTSTGPTWAYRARTMARSSAPISMVRIGKRLFPKERPLHQSNSISKRRRENFTGATEKACA